jgi:CheY-like chemotaxis protein
VCLCQWYIRIPRTRVCFGSNKLSTWHFVGSAMGSPDPAPWAVLAGRVVLVVEDEYLIAAELHEWLRDAGAEVVGPAASSSEALALIEDAAARLDAAVLDVNLGSGDTAVPVAERLERLRVPFLFASGAAHQPAARRFVGRPRLDKPVREMDLLRILLDLIRPQIDNVEHFSS